MQKILQILFKRLFIFVPLILLVSCFAFALLSLSGGNYFTVLKLDPQISPEIISKYEQMYNLDKSWFFQYCSWIRALLNFDLGYSFSQKMPVMTVLKSYFFNTLLLSVCSMIFVWGASIFFGVLGAVYKDTFLEKFGSVIFFVFQAIPSFLAALICIFIFMFLKEQDNFLWLNNLAAIGGKQSVNYEKLSSVGKFLDVLKHLIIPVVAVSLSSIGSLQRIMKNNMLEVMRNNYISTSRACGIHWYKVIFVYALKNAVNPMITIFGYHLSSILAGAALVEIICNWPGMGSIILTAVRSQDIFLVMGGLVLSGLMLFFGNLIADIVLIKTDPRIDFDQKAV